MSNTQLSSCTHGALPSLALAALIAAGFVPSNAWSQPPAASTATEATSQASDVETPECVAPVVVGGVSGAVLSALPAAAVTLVSGVVGFAYAFGDHHGRPPHAVFFLGGAPLFGAAVLGGGTVLGPSAGGALGCG